MAGFLCLYIYIQQCRMCRLLFQILHLVEDDTVHLEADKMATYLTEAKFCIALTTPGPKADPTTTTTTTSMTHEGTIMQMLGCTTLYYYIISHGCHQRIFSRPIFNEVNVPKCSNIQTFILTLSRWLHLVSIGTNDHYQRNNSHNSASSLEGILHFLWPLSNCVEGWLEQYNSLHFNGRKRRLGIENPRHVVNQLESVRDGGNQWRSRLE